MKAILVALTIAVFSSVASSAWATDGQAPKITHSTKFRGIDFLFTEGVDQHAASDGSNFDFAIRAVGFELVSAVGNAAKDAQGVQAIVIDKIAFKAQKTFTVLGIIVDDKFQRLNFNGTSSVPAVQKFLDGLSERRVITKLTAGNAGVELSLTD